MSGFFGWIDDLISRGDVLSWLLVLGLAVLATVVVKGVLHLLTGRLQKLAPKTRTGLDDLWLNLISATKTWFLFFLLWYYLGLPLLEPSAGASRGFRFLLVVTVATQVALWGVRTVQHWRKVHFEKRADTDKTSLAAIGLIATAIQGLFIIIVVLVALSNLGVDIAALIAGLGVGGIAVALAAQNVLGDLFASVSIILDKPFIIGDFVIVGELSGTVEHIGLRTTRVRSLSGEQMIFSNRDLLESRIRNYKSMWQRRVVMNFRVAYSVRAEVLEQIPRWVQQFIEEDSALRFDRCHFSGYGDFALEFETVFFVKDSSYNVFMDHQEKLLLKMYRKFGEESVEFAIPAHALHVDSLPEELSETLSGAQT